MPQESGTQNFSDAFNSALSLQQEKKGDEALTAYQSLLDLGRETLSLQQASGIYHNMSGIAFEKGELLKAYVWSKKALSLNPGNQQAKESYAAYSQKFEIPNIPHQISNYDNFKKIVSVVPTDFFLILSLILTLSTVWIAFKRTITVKKNKLNDIYRHPPVWPVYILSIISVLVIAMSTLNYLEGNKHTAIVITEKAAVQTVPGENKPVIFEAPAGLELEILKQNENFFQVRYAGAFTGWVHRSQIELLSLSFRQTN